jgi:hypothetical protein
VDGIYHVVRAFDSPDVTHVDDSVDPVRDLETIQVCAQCPGSAQARAAPSMARSVHCVPEPCPGAVLPAAAGQIELCKKDAEYVRKAEETALKDVKKTPNMKLPLHFYSTFETV